MTKLSIVIPAYNEEDGIAEIAERVLAARPALQQEGVGEVELLVVDDGSEDRTASIVADMAGVCLLQHDRNRGYGAALKTGFAQASGDLIAFLDADGTYPPEQLPGLCHAVLNGADLAVGTRMTGSDSQMPWTRRVGNFLFANLLSVLGWRRITDSASGMRVFRASVLPLLSPLPDGLNLTPVMTTRAVHEGIAIDEVPISYGERVGRSKLSVVRDGTLFLQSILWTALTYNPVRVLGFIGAAGVLFAVAVAVGLIGARLWGVTSLGPWGVAALFAALVLGVAGVSIFSLGATFNYLVSLFHKRPIQQGLFGRPLFTPSLDRHFGWIGLILSLAGLLLAVASLALGVSGWDIARLWLYLLVGAMFILVGIQLAIFWVLARVLEELSLRESVPQNEAVESGE